MNMEDVTYQRLRASLVIDPMEIDRDLIELPSNIMEASEKAANAVSEKDIAEASLKLAEAEAAHAIRMRAEDGKQPSEAYITREVPRSLEVRKAVEALEDAKLNAALWKALVEALRAKKSSLETMSTLIVAGFLTTDHIVRHRRSEMNAKRNQRRSLD